MELELTKESTTLAQDVRNTQPNQDIYQRLFTALKNPQREHLFKRDITSVLQFNGIIASDQRIKTLKRSLDTILDSDPISCDEFKRIAAPNIGILEKTITGRLIIPDFAAFIDELAIIFEKVRENESGSVASYIPQLSRVDPDNYEMSVCTVDGQMFTTCPQDEETSYCVQSTCKPINYCIALELNGESTVHRHVGREPSGRSFNEIVLNKKQIPHNPLINAGAIMCCSLIKPEECIANRFDHVMTIWNKLCDSKKVGFNNAIYHSEKDTADRNHALAYFMKEVDAFPENTNIHHTLDLYFQSCSIEVTTSQHAKLASVLANAGVCPWTSESIFSPHTVQNCLSLMYSCGMYDFSGEFAFTVGLPAKSGVSGALIIVIPNVAGIVIWSPRLDDMGNSVRGVEFCAELIKKFNFHNYDSLINRDCKIDPRHSKSENQEDHTVKLIWSASQGDLHEVKRLVAIGCDVNSGDYDNRTSLHLAASEGHLEIVKYLLTLGADLTAKDRWGRTPYDDAKTHGHENLLDMLSKTVC